jgi:hypothetical protein
MNKRINVPKRTRSRNLRRETSFLRHLKRTASRKKKPKMKIVVHLGNADNLKTNPVSGKWVYAAKTADYAERFPNIKFIGIDLNYTGHPLKKLMARNWKQMQNDFYYGLSKLKDNSVSIISSEMAVGYYGLAEKSPPMQAYTSKIISVAYRKLEPGGKLMLVGNFMLAEELKVFCKQAGFKEEKIELRELTKKEMQRTRWLSEFANLGEVKHYQLIAQK